MGSLSFLPGSSQPRDWTQVFRIAGRFFTSWATREAHRLLHKKILITEVQKVIESVKIYSNKTEEMENTARDLFPQINQAQGFFTWKFHQKFKK